MLSPNELMIGNATDSALAHDILASNWSLAIGLQDVDLLSVSQFLIDTAKRNIRGEITQAEVARLIAEHHSTGGRRKGHCGKSNIPETPT